MAHKSFFPATRKGSAQSACTHTCHARGGSPKEAANGTASREHSSLGSLSKERRSHTYGRRKTLIAAYAQLSANRAKGIRGTERLGKGLPAHGAKASCKTLELRCL